MPNYRPLAETLRLKSLDNFFGQSYLLNTQYPFRQAIDNHRLHSMILWSPLGTDKTTLARIIVSQVKGYFEQLNAVLDGVKELRAVVENAKKFQKIGKQPLLLVDKIHRFNKTQQDGFLPHIESDLLLLIGTTIKNLSFEINKALLSHLSVYILNALNNRNLSKYYKERSGMSH
ncbi:AAA family ATPase [Candidatus Ruthia endofausta]|uniref:AAA family ATPase n=1 Tax=Candidatus Ruthia endofausta TaxID=2738852 RepID=A0A6N0HQG8_9GAMM|nr:AAA family ATPase [Candidatus Ruthia endofausta]QKQ24639.1 AAA family ATPase [Candidatus Ruthia endofausta]